MVKHGCSRRCAATPERVVDIIHLIHLIRWADAQRKGIESGSLDAAEILRELVWLILHAVPAGGSGRRPMAP